MGTLHEDHCTFFITSKSGFLWIRNVLHKRCKENRNTHFVFSNFFLTEICAVFWDNVEEYCRTVEATGNAALILCAMLCSIPHSIICTRLFRGKMHSDWFNGIPILQGRWQHGEKVGYCYPSGLEKTLCKWDIYVPLVTEGLTLILLTWSIGWAPNYTSKWQMVFNP